MRVGSVADPISLINDLSDYVPPFIAPASSAMASSSPIHPASLIHRDNHSSALLDLVELKVSQQIYNYTIDRVIETVDYAMRKSTASSSRGRAFNKRKPEHVKFAGFVKDVLSRAEVTMPTLLAALVYIDRARPQLHIGLEQWALERVFLGALIVASKYLNDSTLKNVHWAMCTGVFGKRDVGRIEREYLDVLGFELKVSEEDLLSHEQGIISAINESSPIAFPTKSLPSTPTTATVTVVSPPPTPKRERQISGVAELAYPTPATTTTSISSSSYSSHHHNAERRHKRRRLPSTSGSSPLAAAAAAAYVAVAVAPSKPSSSSSRTSSSSPPELDSDSDSGSSDSESSSPRTPPHLAEMDMMQVDGASPTKHQQKQQQPTTARKMMIHGFSTATMDILRSFPIPRMSTS